jgi:hypothetical protein
MCCQLLLLECGVYGYGLAVVVLVVGVVFYLIFMNRKKAKGCKSCKSDLHQ